MKNSLLNFLACPIDHHFPLEVSERRIFDEAREVEEGNLQCLKCQRFFPIIERTKGATVAEIAGVRIVKKHIAGPQGVRGRNSDNTRLREVLGWEPEVPLEEGLARTYAWIEAQVREKLIARRDQAVSVAHGALA